LFVSLLFVSLAMRTAVCAGTGLYAPDRVVPNAYFNDLYGEDVDGFLREHRNIRERRYARDTQSTSDLAVAAARDALANADLDAEALDLVIVSTDTPDFLSPSTAAVVQDTLGATRAGAFDMNAACAGFVAALDTGRTFIEARGRYEHVLVVGAYLMSRFIDYSAKNIASLFADGAGAVVLSATEATGPGICASRLMSEGEYHDYMGIYDGGAAAPITKDREGCQKLEFRHPFPDGYNPDRWTALVKEVCASVDAVPRDVDHYFFTQININSIRETLDRLGEPHCKAHTIMDRFGYTGNACIAMALADANNRDRLQPGDLVLLIASGGGAALAGMALRWGRA
jgi:3-oxoacyl-[acyl-carrier-protein] synthase-3